MMAAERSRWLVMALHPATPGTAACSSPGSGCPAGRSTNHAHLGATREQPQWDLTLF